MNVSDARTESHERLRVSTTESPGDLRRPRSTEAPAHERAIETMVAIRSARRDRLYVKRAEQA
jgi:hypothetical protein